MWKTAFYACLLLLAMSGKQLTSSRSVHVVHGSWESSYIMPLATFPITMNNISSGTITCALCIG